MIRVYFLILFILIKSADASVELDVLSGKIEAQPTLRGDTYCAQCAFLTTQASDRCTSVEDSLVSTLLKKTLYSLLIGQSIIDNCSSAILSESNSPKTLDNNISSMLQHEFHVSQAGLEACFEKNKIDFKSIKNGKAGSAKVLTSYLHVLHRNILDNQAEQLEQLASIDILLGQKPLEKFKCTNHFSSKCKELSSCSNPEAFNQVTDFSIETISKTRELFSQKDELKKLFLKGSLDKMSYQKSIKEIDDNIQLLQEMAPWLQGDFLESLYIDNTHPQKSFDKEKFKAIFESAFKKQLEKSKSTLSQNYLDAAVTITCLKNNIGCSKEILERANNFIKRDYSKNIINENQYSGTDPKSRASFIEALETNFFLGTGKCVSDLLKGKSEIDEAAAVTGAVGLGLITSGFGGLLSLGKVALQVAQTGNRLKAIGSMSLLSAEAKVSYDSLKLTTNECSQAINNLKDASQAPGKSCSKMGASVFQFTSLKPCLASIALSTAPIILAAKPGRASASKSAPHDTKAIVEENRAMFISRITNPLISHQEKLEIAEVLSKLKLTPAQSDDVIKNLNVVISSEKDKNRLKNYINYMMSLHPDDQLAAVQKIDQAIRLSGNMNPGGYVESFYVKENKFYLFEKLKTDAKKKALMKNGLKEEDALIEATNLARLERAKLQKKYYSCMSKTITPELKTAGKRFAGFTMAMGVGGAAYGFTKNNLDIYENNKPEFFGKLSYDIAMAYFLSRLSAQIMKSPEGSLFQRYKMANVGAAKIGLIDSVVYSAIYGVSEEEARKKIEEIMISPDLQKELKILDGYINKENLVDKFAKNIIDGYKKILSSPNKADFTEQVQGIDNFSSLTLEDLEKPEIKEKLVRAVISKMNSGDSAFLATGDKGADRWLSDRAWNAAIGIPKGILVGVGIFQVLCLGSDNPMLSYGVASGLQFTNQFLSGDAYYAFRKEFIGQ